MDSDWETFTSRLNQVIESKIAPVEQELNSQDDLIKKLANSLSQISEAIQLKYGRLPPAESPIEACELKAEISKTESQDTLDQ